MKKKPAKLSIIKQSWMMEPLSAASPQRPACKECGLCNTDGYSFAMPRVPEEWSGELVVVHAGNEDASQRNTLRRAWRKAGWEDSDVAMVPVVRCGDEAEPSMKQIRACRPFLLKALWALNPKNVLAVGSEAMMAMRNNGEKNITKNRGKLIGPVLLHLPSEPSK